LNFIQDNVILLIGVDIMLKIEKQAKAIKITEVKESNYKGQFIVEPLYRGYGNTLGNALRRVLLSSIPGAAIKGMRIEGVLSEFTVMDGVKEAVTEIILNVKENNGISKKVTAGLNTLAVRMPSNVTARELLKETKVLLAAPSANTSGKPSPTKFEHVYHDLNGKIDVIIEDEQSDIGLESTVIDCTRYPLVIARPGDITKEDIESVLGEGSVKYNEEVLTQNAVPISPGMKYRHYSPEAELVLFNDSFENLINILKDKNQKTGFITYKEMESRVNDLNVSIKYLADNEKSVEQSNKNLYNILREFDEEKVEEIFILPIEETKENKALLNRLNKAISKK